MHCSHMMMVFSSKLWFGLCVSHYGLITQKCKHLFFNSSENLYECAKNMGDLKISHFMCDVCPMKIDRDYDFCTELYLNFMIFICVDFLLKMCSRSRAQPLLMHFCETEQQHIRKGNEIIALNHCGPIQNMAQGLSFLI